MNESTEYQALSQGAGYVELEGWSLISLTGSDRASLLHNFCTANIKQLPIGSATEAFILNEKGKVLWFGWVLARPQQLLLCSAGAVGPKIAAHLDRYVIREDVQVVDQSQQLEACFVTGQLAEAKLLAGIGRNDSTHRLPARNQALELDTRLGKTCLAQLEIAGWGYLWVAPAEGRGAVEREATDSPEQQTRDSVEAGIADSVDPQLQDSNVQQSIPSILKQAEIEACSLNSLHAVRIEHKVPWFGWDIDESNLPQEVNRDATAISFTKGCYLGQETVARLDALGRVNQLLQGLEFETEIPPQPGLVVEQDGKKVLRVTSIARVNQSFIGLGYLRREVLEAGAEIPYAEGLVRIRTGI